MKKTIIFLVFLISLTACEQLVMQPSPDSSPIGVFDQVWNFANERYSFFEYKKVDWNASKAKFRSQVTDKTTDEELFAICAKMLYDLQDEHVNLMSKFNISTNPQVMLDYPTNLNTEVLERNYFKNGLQYVDGCFALYDFGDVLYVRYGSFQNTVTSYAMDYVATKMQSKKGLILDVRSNGGGSVGNVNTILGRMVQQKTFVGMEWIKNGPGREDFRKDSLFVNQAKEKNSIFDKPVVVLTNRESYSATNRFAAVAKFLPNITLVGGKTGGGGGYPSTTQLSNGWTLRVSASRMFDINGLNTENGIEPEVNITITGQDILAGKDPILDQGLKLAGQ